MVLSVLVFANDAEAAGLVWRAVNKTGSLLADLGDVAGGCTNGQTLHYQSNSTFICKLFKVDTKTAQNDVFITGINNQTGVITTNQFSVNSNTCSGQFVSAINNATGQVTCTTPSSSGITSINADTTAAQLISGVAGNSSATTAGGTTTINLGSNVLMTGGSAQSTSQFKPITLNGQNNIDFANTGLVVRNPASSFAETLAGGIVTANTTITLPLSTSTLISGGVLAANVTASNLSSHSLVFTIPLTANSGNSISGIIIGTSNTVNGAVQAGMNTTISSIKGWCTFTTVGTASTSIVSYFPINATSLTTMTNRATLWIPTVVDEPMPIKFDCTVKTGPTAGNAKVWIRPEVASTVQAKAGSYYIRAP